MRRAFPLLVLGLLVALTTPVAAAPSAVAVGVVEHVAIGETSTPCVELTPFEFVMESQLARVAVAYTKPRPQGTPGCLGVFEIYRGGQCTVDAAQTLRCERDDGFSGSTLTINATGELYMEAWYAYHQHTLKGTVAYSRSV